MVVSVFQFGWFLPFFSFVPYCIVLVSLHLDMKWVAV